MIQITTEVIAVSGIVLIAIDRGWTFLKSLLDNKDGHSVCAMHASLEEEIQAVRKSVEHLEVLNEKDNQYDTIMRAIRDVLGVPGPTAADLRRTVNVLVLDDEKGVREIFKSGLETPGISCMCAASYYEAHDVVKNLSFDIVIVDIELDGRKNGLDFAREYKEAHMDSRVFVITGKVIDYKKDAFVERVFLKPVRLTNVLEAIRDERRD
jgi:CheY-like chemotaxis protein